VREAIVRSICTALEIHAQLEEEIFYPALRAINPNLPELGKSVPEHDEMRGHIEQLRKLSVKDPEYDEALRTLMRGVIHHVADEETVLLPLAEQQFEANRLSELGAQMTERRLVLAKPKAREMAVDLARASPGKSALVLAGALTATALLVTRARRNAAEVRKLSHAKA
jgi:hypothetical protein